MREVTFLEKLAEDVLEGGFARALKARLQPVQIAKALAREMERSSVVGPDGPLAPNRYEAHLHPDDLAAFAAFQTGLERELSSYLTSRAERRGFRLLAPPSVHLLPASPPGRRGRVVRVEATITDPEPPPVSPPSPPGWGATAEMPAVLPMGAASALRAAAHLVGPADEVLALSAEATAIGRAIDNDIVLEGGGVSRHHARLVWDGADYVLVDLDSTNGSFVNGGRVAAQSLADGDEVSFGGARFIFRLDPTEPLP